MELVDGVGLLDHVVAGVARRGARRSQDATVSGRLPAVRRSSLLWRRSMRARMPTPTLRRAT